MNGLQKVVRKMDVKSLCLNDSAKSFLDFDIDKIIYRPVKWQVVFDI